MILITRMKNKIHAETIVAIMMMTIKFKLHVKTMRTFKTGIHGDTLMTKMTIKIKIIQKRW